MTALKTAECFGETSDSGTCQCGDGPISPDHLSALHQTLAAEYERLTAQHQTLVDTFRTSKGTGRTNLEVAWTLWEQVRARRAGFLFWLKARVGGSDCVAAWLERGLILPEELAARAEVVISLEETFQAPDTGRTLSPGLGEPIQAALTLMRASDQILEFRLRIDELKIDYQSDAAEIC